MKPVSFPPLRRRTRPISPANRLQFSQLEPRVMLATLAQAGISQRAINYINGLQSNWSSLVLNDQALQNTLNDIIESKTAPTTAKLITGESEFSQIVSGGTYLIKGDLTVTQTFKVPSNVTIYVDGSIYKQGNFSGALHSTENKDDAIFEVTSKVNVNLIGINNARLHSNPDLSASAPHTTAIIIEGTSENVRVEGFEIASVWEGVVAYYGTKKVTVENNYIRDTVKRAIWFLGTTDSFAAHNFIENAGVDGIDFDAYTKTSVAYENIVIGAGRWAGFVEEGANNNYFVRGMAIMADLGNPNTGYQMAWADNGTSPYFTANNPGLYTRDNYFIDNVVFRPSTFTEGGDYFAKTGTGTQKGMTYFWSNRGYGAGQSTSLFQVAEWLNYIPTAGGVGNAINGVIKMDNWNLQFNANAEYVNLFDYGFTAAEGFVNGNLNGQKGFVGQNGTTVNSSGIGTTTTNGGSYLRNAYGTNLLTAAGKANFASKDRMKFTVDYEFTLPSFSSLPAAKFGILDNISDFGALTPQQGFEIKFDTANTATGGSLQLVTNGITTNLSAFSFGLNPQGVGGAVDLQSDPFRVTYEITSNGAGNFTLSRFEILNQKTSIRTELPTGTSFAFAGTPYYSQGLALNGNPTFVGVSTGLQIEFGAAPVGKIMGRHLFYDGSTFDGGTPGASPTDDTAIATEKAPLYNGGIARFANYSSYVNGINGIMIDVAALGATPLASDFQFRIGNNNTPGSWTTAPNPDSISMRPGAGVGGSSRVTLVWNNGISQGKWLQVKTLATPNTNLGADDVFYFGNAVGETGNSSSDAIVNLSDLSLARTNQTGFGNAVKSNKYDFDRDGKVNLSDVGIVRQNQSGFSPLLLINLAGQNKSSNQGGGKTGDLTPLTPLIGAGNATNNLSGSVGLFTPKVKTAQPFATGPIISTATSPIQSPVAVTGQELEPLGIKLPERSATQKPGQSSQQTAGTRLSLETDLLFSDWAGLPQLFI